MHRRLSLWVLVGILAVLAAAGTAAAHDPDGEGHGNNHEPATIGPDLSQNMRLLARAPLANPAPNNAVLGSDLAFWGERAYAGNYGGFRIFDISQPSSPRELADVRCFGPQNDVSVWNNRLVFLSVDAPQTSPRCGSRTTNYTQTPDAWEGIRIFDVRNPRDPVFVKAVATDCGSHTHTLVPDPDNDRLLIYVSSYALGASAIGPNCPAPTAENPVSHDKISIIEVPLDDPRDAAVINEPSSMFQGGEVCTPTATNPFFPDLDDGFICNPNDDESSRFASRGCHDIQVLLSERIAACSAMAEGQLWDISDLEEPRLIKRIANPNVEFWHNASFTWDGKYVVFSDEAGGGGEPWCKPGDPDTIGANWFYPVAGESTEALGHFKTPRTTMGTCTAHNGNFLPVRGRYVYAQAWYTLGTSVSDITNLAQPREIAFFQAGDRNVEDGVNESSDTWSSYFYRGFVFGNDINRGFETLFLRDPARRQARGLAYENPQTQQRVLFP